METVAIWMAAFAMCISLAVLLLSLRMIIEIKKSFNRVDSDFAQVTDDIEELREKIK